MGRDVVLRQKPGIICFHVGVNGNIIFIGKILKRINAHLNRRVWLRNPDADCVLTEWNEGIDPIAAADDTEIKRLFLKQAAQMGAKSINNIEYILVGDYYIPDRKLPNEERPIGKYGWMHREYLKEHNSMMFNDLVLDGQLWSYLADLNEQAENWLQFIIKQMQETENVTDELKEQNQMAWVQAMNNSYNRAEEIVIHELVL